MTRKPITQDDVKDLTGDPIFTVDEDGNIQPTATQNLSRGAGFLIQPAGSPAFQGYVCAWRNGACQCSAMVTDLDGEPHMEVNGAYTIKSTAPLAHFTLYATKSESGNGPTTDATNGDIYVGT